MEIDGVPTKGGPMANDGWPQGPKAGVKRWSSEVNGGACAAGARAGGVARSQTRPTHLCVSGAC